MVSDYLSLTMQRYKIISKLPNISALFFKFFLKKNNPPLFGRKDGLLTDNRGLFSGEVKVAEVLAAGGQLVVNQRGQQLLQLHEEAFAGLVAVGEHVEVK